MFPGADGQVLHESALGQAPALNQRRFRRYSIRLPCRVKPRASGKSPVMPELAVEIVDVSGGGLFFLAPARWAVGTAIKFQLDLPVDVGRRPVGIRCRGTITRVIPQDGGRIGIGATIDHYKISALSRHSAVSVVPSAFEVCGSSREKPQISRIDACPRIRKREPMEEPRTSKAEVRATFTKAC